MWDNQQQLIPEFCDDYQGKQIIKAEFRKSFAYIQINLVEN